MSCPADQGTSQDQNDSLCIRYFPTKCEIELNKWILWKFVLMELTAVLIRTLLLESKKSEKNAVYSGVDN